LKLGDPDAALARFEEAASIFDACNATNHYDAISNGHSIAQLLVEVGEWDQAEAKYEEVSLLRKTVYGKNSIAVAKTVNDYAVVLAKHGRMDASLSQYSEARKIFQVLQKNEKASSTQDNDNDIMSKYDFDVTLIDLNMASIKSKNGDYDGAITFYQQGVTGLKRHIEREQKTEILNENMKLSTQKRHLVSAIGRIGSLKMKMGDNAGALDAYLTLLHEVNEDSPTSSMMEKAKAHVKCATIYRQSPVIEDADHAISHLEKAFHMYTRLHGPNHKDTQAIASSLRQWKLQGSEAYDYDS